MSFHVVNPGGRIVAIDDEQQYRNLITQGFRPATSQEEATFIQQRNLMLKKMAEDAKKEILEKEENGVYLQTVSQNGADGYSVASTKVLKELHKLNVNISLTKGTQKVGLLFHNPYSILRMDNSYRILYTMFESTKIPSDWHDYLEAADLILVPSKWCQKVFKDCGFDSKVVPLGYDNHTYTYIDRQENRVDRPFTFLHYNAFNIRKGFFEVFNAFNKAFGREKNPKVKMILKTTAKQLPIPILPSEYPNIEVIQGEFNDNEMRDLHARSDCFVFPSRGEGFGMTPLEAMATGMSAIIPNAHGITEYFNPECMYEVRIKEEIPAQYTKYRNMNVGNMYMSDEDHLAEQMKYIFEHQTEAYEKGKAAAEYVQQWTYQKTAVILKDILLQYTEKQAVDRPIKNLLHLEEV